MKKILSSVGVLVAVFLVGLFVVQGSSVFGEETGKLVVQKVVINDNGGIKEPSSFSFQVNGETPIVFENDGRNTLDLAPGNYTVTEPAFEGYTSSLEGCTEIEILPGSKNVCTITNDDIVPATGSLKVSKKTNDGDGTFHFKIIDTKTLFDITTTEKEGEYTLNDLLPGKYSVREEVQDGWEMTVNTCEEVEVVAGKTSECKIRNTKAVEQEEGEDPTKGILVIEKTVSNDDGHTMTVVDFPGFTINGGEPTPFRVDSENPLKGKNILRLEPGVYNISEPVTEGYTKIAENCSEITVVAGKEVTCSLLNEDTASNQGGDDNTNNNGGGNGGGNGLGNSSSSTGTTTTPSAPEGQVLGASTEEASTTSMCTPYITTYMRLGGKNNKDEVKLVQAFLNENLSLNPALTVDGIFGKTTKTAVIAFQEKHKDEVLIPWKSFGLKGEKGTGIVYKTTLRWINMVKCSSLNIPMPQLP